MKTVPLCKMSLFVAVVLAPCSVAAQGNAGQDNYAGRFDVFAGFTYFESPQINLAERGFHIQAAYNERRWLGLAFDYSNVNGTLNLIPSYLPNSLQAQLAPLLGSLSTGYHPAVPTNTNTQTFAMGPAFIKRYRRFALILHPSVGAVREVATPHPNDLLTMLAVSIFLPEPHKLDWTGFYGVGGGVDVKVTKHFAIRMHCDVVWDHLINDILGNGHWTIRSSIGPAFQFGKNVE